MKIDTREDFLKTRAGAKGVTFTGAGFVVLGTMLFAAKLEGGWQVICWAVGFAFMVLGQLMHIRAGIEEANFLKRKETRDQELEKAVEKLSSEP